MCLVGGIFVILVVKMVFGGIGCNFVNLVFVVRVFLLVLFLVVMIVWI